MRRPAALRQEIERLLRRREEQRVICCRMTARYGPGGGRGRWDRGEEALAALAESGRVLEEKRQELARAEGEADAMLRALSALPGRTAARDAERLRLRYLLGLEWSAVREALAKKGYPAAGLRTVYNWNRSALRWAERCCFAPAEGERGHGWQAQLVFSGHGR